MALLWTYWGFQTKFSSSAAHTIQYRIISRIRKERIVNWLETKWKFEFGKN